jgi:hypothetical protein
MRRPSLNASTTVAPAPGTPGFAARHARRCSSDRKKFSVVQSDVASRHWPSARLPTHTMTSSDPGPTPSGPTPSARGAPQWWQSETIWTSSPNMGAMPSASIAQHA